MDQPDLDHHWAANLAFGDLPGEAARRFGDREALLFRNHRYSFRQISQEVDRLARGFMHIGVAPGERVCLWLTNCPEWIFAMFALAKIGAVHVPVNTRFRVADLEYVLAQSEAATLITHDMSGPVDYLAMARELLPAPADPDDRLVRSAAAPGDAPPRRSRAMCGTRASTPGPTCSTARGTRTRRRSARGRRPSGPPTRSSSCTPRGRRASPRA